MTPVTIERPVDFGRRGTGGRAGSAAGLDPTAPPPGRVPRVARLMALAIRLDGLVRAGTVGSYADLARLGRVTRARVTQVMNLVHLAPDVQEALLFLPPVARGRDPVKLADLQPIAAALDWREQRRRWRDLTRPRAVADRNGRPSRG